MTSIERYNDLQCTLEYCLIDDTLKRLFWDGLLVDAGVACGSIKLPGISCVKPELTAKLTKSPIKTSMGHNTRERLQAHQTIGLGNGGDIL